MNTPSNSSESPSAPQEPAAQQPAAPAPAPAQSAGAPGAPAPRPGGYGPRPGGGRPPFGRRPGGPGGGDRRPGGRRFFARRKVCTFCVDHVKAIDYKDAGKLRRFISDRGKIEPRRKTGNCAKHQRLLAVALKRARHLALLPYTPEHIHGMSMVGMA